MNNQPKSIKINKNLLHNPRQIRKRFKIHLRTSSNNDEQDLSQIMH